MNDKKIILDLCGGSGAWSAPYREAGYDVRLVTLPGENVLTYKPPQNVYGILAAPPCSEFSQAKQPVPAESQVWPAVQVMAACLSIIWKCQARKPLSFWALENPLGRMSFYLGKPAFIFEHWQFNDDGYKPTCIWGCFEPPVPANPFKPYHARYIADVKGSRNGGRAAERAKTPPNFAKAFFQANR